MALLVAATLALAGCSTEPGTGPTQAGRTWADDLSGEPTAPTTVLTPTPKALTGSRSTGTPQRTTTGTTPVRRPASPTNPSQPLPPGLGHRWPTPMRPSTPIRVVIPAIGVDSGLIRLGLKSNGGLQVPPDGFPAGWFTGGPTPGEKGPAVVLGHVHWAGRPGVFARLRGLQPGDKITMTRQDRSAAVFRVVTVRQYPKSTFPSAAVYGDLDHAGLRLITCGGLDRISGKYEANLVVFADLIG
ncbi:sortase family protein [Kribbella voronezhensis]|uniref:Sortase family protein n=1 Tax=Kribbella voronezhensis TaxID=2512212 RepID=A0A4R7T0E3_9ACTN|nr:class F sortase [Kribbella voronezhensis]TDU84298.1 sortase family protein [Kribbella voronezhensis]